MKGAGYQPSYRNDRLLMAFEHEIGMPVRRWMIDMASQGFSSRWMASKIGVDVHVVWHLLKAWNIKTSCKSRIYQDGTPLVAFRLRQLGLFSKSMSERVHRRMKKGMTFHDAVAEIQERDRRVPLLTWLRDVHGITTHSDYAQVHKWVMDGISREDAVDILLKNRRRVAA